MPSVDDVFGGNSLKAADIQGREPTVVIAKVEAKEFTSAKGSQRKLVIHFHGAKKVLICNKTNANRIAFMHGKDYALWVGKKITLFVDPFVEFAGEITSAIRVKPPAAQDHMAGEARPAPQQHVARPSSSEIDPPLPNSADDFADQIPF